MPSYDYYCPDCGYEEEILQKMTDAPLIECTKCKKGTFKRKFGRGIGLQFIGSGFYITDYCQTPVSSPNQPPANKLNQVTKDKSKACGCNKTSCDS